MTKIMRDVKDNAIRLDIVPKWFSVKDKGGYSKYLNAFLYVGNSEYGGSLYPFQSPVKKGWRSSWFKDAPDEAVKVVDDAISEVTDNYWESQCQCGNSPEWDITEWLNNIQSELELAILFKRVTDVEFEYQKGYPRNE